MTSKPRFPFGGLVKRLVIATVAILVFSVGALSEETPASGEGEQYVLLSNLGFSYSQNLSSSIVQNYLPTTTAKYAVHFTTGRHPDGYHLNSVDIALLRLVRMDIFVCPLHPTGPLDPLSWQYGSQITNADGDITHTNHVLSNNCSALIAPNPIAQGVNNFQVEGDLTLAANSTYALVFVRASHQTVNPRLSFNPAGQPGDSDSISPGWSNPNRISLSRYYVGGWFERDSTSLLRFQLNGRPVADLANLPPFFSDRNDPEGADPKWLGVDENVSDGHSLGPIAARDADNDTLTYTYSGTDAAAFHEDFVHAASGGRITVRAGRSPNFERKSSYSFTIHVSDGKDSAGGTSTAIDDEVDVTVDVRNMWEKGGLTFSSSEPEVGNPITVTLHDEDGSLDDISWHWWTGDRPNSYQTSVSDYSDTYTPTEADIDKYLFVNMYYRDLHFGNYRLQAWVANSVRASTGTRTLSLTSDTKGVAPTVATMIPDQTAMSGTAFSYAFPAATFTDADSDTLTYTATKSDNSALPAWLSFTAATRAFSGTPQAADVETVSVKVTASDGNSGSVSDTFDIVVSLPGDTTAPRVASIVRETPTSSPTNADSLTWRVTFSEAVSNVDAADFAVSGTTATVTAVAAVSGLTGGYDVTASGGNLAGVSATVGLAIAASHNIQDGASNALSNTAPTGTNDNSYVVDNTAPSVTISGVPSASDAPFTATFTFSEAVTGFAVGDITLSNATASIFTSTSTSTSTATASSFTVTSTTVSTALVTPAAAGAVTVDVSANAAQDAAGNGNTAATRASSTYAVPAITIVAGTSPVAEGTSAVFTLSRAGSTTAALTVNVTVSEAGGDMVAASNEGARTVAFLANSATATLSVTTASDSVDEANSVVTATISADTGSPASYSVATPASAMVTVQDNDTRRVKVSATALTVNEGTTGTYTVVLDSQPTANVTVTPSRTGSTDVTFSPPTLTFTALNWNTVQPVTVTAAQDSDAVDDSATISHAVTGGDYVGVTVDSVVVTVDDDESVDTVPGVPTDLSASTGGDTRINLSWTAPGDDGGSSIIGYRIEVSPDGNTNWTDLVANTGNTATTYAHIGLAAGTTRHYRVSAINAAGAGGPSNIDDATAEAITGPITTGGGGGGGGGPTPSEVEFEWNVKRDIEELDGGNDRATGVWSDGTTLWVADNADGTGDAVYAYDLASGERVEEREFALDETNRAPRGVWSDRSVVWVSDSGQNRMFAHDLATGERLPDREFALAAGNAEARGIWSDGETMWVLDGRADALFAYDLASGELLGEYALDAANDDPRGIWSDGVTIWVSDHGAKRLFAYRLPALPDAETDSGDEDADDDARELERVSDEEFTELSKASNNSPRGIWSDGDVMYVADESDDRVYSYNMPADADARLASLTLSGIDIGEFDPRRTEYEAVVADGVTETTVEAEAMQRRTDVAIDPPDADVEADGHQVALQDLGEIAVTVTSQDGSRKKTYRVQFPETAWDPARDPWPHCLRGAVSEGFSLVVHEGGSVEELIGCAESRGIAALYALHEGVYVSYILGAPGFVNAGFLELFPDGLPPITPLIAASNGPPSPDPFGDLEDGGQPWPECLRGDIAAGFSLVVYEGGGVEELEACAQSRDVAALYALSDGEFVSYILGAPDLVNAGFLELFAEGLPPITPLVARSDGPPGGR